MAQLCNIYLHFLLSAVYTVEVRMGMGMGMGMRMRMRMRMGMRMRISDENIRYVNSASSNKKKRILIFVDEKKYFNITSLFITFLLNNKNIG